MPVIQRQSAEVVDLAVYRERHAKRAEPAMPGGAIAPFFQPATFPMVTFGYWVWPIFYVPAVDVRY